MKKIFFSITLSVILIFGCSFNTNADNIRFESLDEINEPQSVTPIDLGILDGGESEISAQQRNAWDLQTYRGKVYIGGGSTAYNSGAFTVYTLDNSTTRPKYSGKLATEAVEYFNVINGRLIVTASDPTGWGRSEYYLLTEKNKWETHNNIPQGIHTYQMIEYHGKYFLCGSSNDGYMVWSKPDFTKYDDVVGIKTYYHGELHQRITREYRLFVFNDLLYAYCDAVSKQMMIGNELLYTRSNDPNLFVYNEKENAFYDCENENLRDLVSYEKYPAEYSEDAKSNPDLNNFEYDGKMYFMYNSTSFYAGKGLMETSDLINYKPVVMGDESYDTRDYIKVDDTYYFLSSKRNAAFDYTVSVFRSKNMKDFSEILNFKAKTFARSFEYLDGSFYVSLGSSSIANWNDESQYTDEANNEETGRMLRIDLVQPTLYGDANGDKTLNAKDVLLLRQYIAQWDVKIFAKQADCYTDESINAKDVLLLRQKLAEYKVTLGWQ